MLSMTCNNVATTLNYGEYCSTNSTVSLNNGNLVCDSPLSTPLPDGNYLQTSSTCNNFSFDGVTLSAICSNKTVSLRYLQSCQVASSVNYTNGNLQCVNALVPPLPSGNYLTSCYGFNFDGRTLSAVCYANGYLFNNIYSNLMEIIRMNVKILGMMERI